MHRIEAVSRTNNESDRVTYVLAISFTNNCNTDHESEYKSDNELSIDVANVTTNNKSAARSRIYGDGFR